MPLTHSIANGITFGILAWVWLRILTGRFREVHPILWFLAAALTAFLAFR